MDPGDGSTSKIPKLDELKNDESDHDPATKDEIESEDQMMEANQDDLIISPVQPQVLPEIKYEYLDHTADVQLHAWGDTLQEAFEQCAMAMFAYMTEIDKVDNFGSVDIQAEGHDMLSLLYGFLDEFLFTFNADPNFLSRKVHITSFDRENFKITATGYGETFDLQKHPQGTEVKAITYSNMQFHESDTYCEVFVIIDI
jgi:SHS2 domain-containing protein